MTTELERTAYHEAGHAVIAEVFGILGADVTITPSQEYDGLTRTEVADWFQPDMPDLEDPERQRLHSEAHIICTLAGPISEARRTGTPPDWDDPRYEQDRSTIVDHALRVAGTGEAVTDYIAGLSERTTAEVGAHWGVIDAVAQNLLARRTLSATEVRQIIRR